VKVTKNSTDITTYFHLRDSTNGTSKTGLAFNSAGAVASYVRDKGARTAITLATLTSSSAVHSDGGFVEVDGTNAKGLYRFDLPDAVISSGVSQSIVHVGFTGVFEESLRIELEDLEGIQKNTALNNFEFPMVLSSDNVTLATGLTITSQVSKDGSAFGPTDNSASEIGSTGIYKINLSASDLNGDIVTFKFTAATADTRVVTIKTVV
jgi:hypothetical protein